MSKITLSVIVYAPFLNKTAIKTNKKQMNSSADTFFWMTRYMLHFIFDGPAHLLMCPSVFLNSVQIQVQYFLEEIEELWSLQHIFSPNTFDWVPFLETVITGRIAQLALGCVRSVGLSLLIFALIEACSWINDSLLFWWRFISLHSASLRHSEASRPWLAF